MGWVVRSRGDLYDIVHLNFSSQQSGDVAYCPECKECISASGKKKDHFEMRVSDK